MLSLKVLNPLTPLLSYALSTDSKQLNASNSSSCYLPTMSSKSANLHVGITSSPFNILTPLTSSTVTFAQPPTSLSLHITDGSFLYASPRLWNQPPVSLHLPHPSLRISTHFFLQHFSVSRPSHWNSLPETIHTATDPKPFF